jgi:DNA-binding Xre family transcriptional regulator
MLNNRSPKFDEFERAVDPDEIETLQGMLDEARAMVKRLETLLGGTLAGTELHPIVSWRQRRNMSQSELARAVGISPPALCRIEHSSGFRGRKETREKIAAVLNVSEELLVARSKFGG